MNWRSTAIVATSLLCAACQRKAHEVSPVGVAAFEVSLATFADHAVLGWHGGKGGHTAIVLQPLNAELEVQGDLLAITDGSIDAFEPDLQPLADGLLVAWYEKDKTGVLSANIARVDSGNNILWTKRLSSPGRDGRNPVVRATVDAVLVAWIATARGQSALICTERLTLSGESKSPARCNAPAGAETWNLNAAVDAQGIFYVVYDAPVISKAKELHLLKSAATVNEHIVLSGEDGHDSVYPDIAIEAEHVAVSWVDSRDGVNEVYLFVGPLAALHAPLDTLAKRVTHGRGSSSGAYLSWNHGRLALAWNEAAQDVVDVQVQRFSANGSALGTSQRLTRHKSRSLVPSIRPWREGFAVAWNNYPGENDGSDHGDAAQRSSVAMIEAVD